LFAGTIRGGDRVENARGKLVDALTDISETENENSLTDSMNSLIIVFVRITFR